MSDLPPERLTKGEGRWILALMPLDEPNRLCWRDGKVVPVGSPTADP